MPLFSQCFLLLVYEFYKSGIFQVLPHNKYLDWWEYKIITPLSAQGGDKPEDIGVNHLASAELDAFRAPAKSGPTTRQSLEAKIKSFFSFGLSVLLASPL